jgi:hypothetical protein
MRNDMGEFKEHPTKKVIREQWCKPLLKFINKSLGYKLVYLGLPGIEALDIISWIDYLERIIAFQCRKYPYPSDPSQPKDGIEKLRKFLDDLEKKGLIKTYSLFDGYIEEVVLRGEDNSGNTFSQKEVVTVYNLDFCNPLTVPLIMVNKGKVSKHYKLEAIRKLLEIQRDIDSESRKKFIMFLTVHSDFWKYEAEKLIGKLDSNVIKSYIKNLSKLSEKNNNIRLLKLYVFYVLRDHFCNCQFIPEFLPPIYYEGIGNKWLMLFTIIGTYFGSTASASAPFFQNEEELLKNKMLTINLKRVECLNIKDIKEAEVITDSVELFTRTISYKKHWNHQQ